MKNLLILVCTLSVLSTALAGGLFLPDEIVTDEMVGKNLKYDPVLGETLVYASGLAYCPPTDIKAWNCGAACGNLTNYTYYYTYQGTIDKALAFTVLTNDNNKTVVFTFRGTKSLLQLAQELTKAGGSNYTTDHFNYSGAQVLTYFQNTYKKNFQSLVLSKLLALGKSTRRTYQYIFTGHNIGGAYATLAALDASTYGYVPVTSTTPLLMTFGSPRVGNYYFATNASEIIPESYRVVHYNDLICHLPPCPGQSPIAFGCTTPSTTVSGEKDSLWYGWHVIQEIFYNEGSTSYRSCSQTTGEDTFCSDALPIDSYSANRMYLGIDIDSLCKDPSN